jgi:hypothetical protein
MCWACEEQDLLFRYELELAVARGVIPDGFTAEDFEAAGLPVPGQKKEATAKTPLKPAGAFVCDTPDKE